MTRSDQRLVRMHEAAIGPAELRGTCPLGAETAGVGFGRRTDPLPALRAPRPRRQQIRSAAPVSRARLREGFVESVRLRTQAARAEQSRSRAPGCCVV